MIQEQVDSETEESSDEEAGSLGPEAEDLSDEDDSSSSAGFFDLEAEESSDEGDSDGDDSSTSEPAFGRFMELPPEIRARVWEMFCPDLVSRGRFLAFDERTWELEEQTKSLRDVMAIHLEPRRLASVAFPHLLETKFHYDDCTMFPFHVNKHSDIVYYYEPWNIDPSDEYFKPPVSAIDSIAISQSELLYDCRCNVKCLLKQLPDLKRLYLYTEGHELEANIDLRWTVSDRVHHHWVQSREIEPDLGEDYEIVYCWPDVDRHPGFEMPAYLHTVMRHKFLRLIQKHGVEILPLVRFAGDDLRRFYRLLATKEEPHLYESSDEGTLHDGHDSENRSDTDSSEYESEGIDDTPLDDDSEEGDEEEVIYHSEGESHGDGDDDDGDDDDGRLQAVSEPSEARFSSPELDEERSEEPEQRAPKRKIVIDSDDDEEEAEETEPRAKRLRPARRVVTDSDSDESVPRAVVESDGQPSGRGASLTRENRLPAEEEDSSDSGRDSSDVTDDSDSSDETDGSDSSDGADDSDSKHAIDDGDSVEDDDQQDDDEGDGADEEGMGNDMMSEGSDGF
ncbi:hypothetical protein CP533_1132 [Ophiocordyceps camponoti-saundersi (nom. inval.)]|nr:hypothetical protein CP533_1132 [Ophiocordyceps camponoti-saundersi (nom. inval.)]